MASSKYDGATIGALQERIENGMVFEASALQVVANAGGKVDWIFKTGKKFCIIDARSITTNGDELQYQVFKSPTVVTLGTAAITGNRNGRDNLGKTAVLYTASAFTGGTPIPSVYLPGSQGQGSRTVGQFSQENFIRILEPNTTYGARLTNNGIKNGANAELYLMWAEVTDDKPFR